MKKNIYDSRWNFIKERIIGKNVLEIGPAELIGTVNAHKKDRWLHAKIKEVAAKLTGLELSEEQVIALRKQGYSIIQGNAESFKLEEIYDVIFAGEIIEHLSNPGLFLDSVSNHLAPGGSLILTTPNRYNILEIFKILKTNCVPRYRKNIAKHLLFFDEDSIESILLKHGFIDIHISYCKWVGPPSPSWLTRTLVDFFALIRPGLTSTILVEALKK